MVLLFIDRTKLENYHICTYLIQKRDCVYYGSICKPFLSWEEWIASLTAKDTKRLHHHRSP